MGGGNRGAEYVNGRIRILIGEPEPDSFIERAWTLLIVTLSVKDLGAMSFLVNSLALLVNSIASGCGSGIWKGLSKQYVQGWTHNYKQPTNSHHPTMEAADDFQSSKCPPGQVRRDRIYWSSPVGMKVEKTVGSRGVGSRTREVGHEIYNLWVLRSRFILLCTGAPPVEGDHHGD